MKRKLLIALFASGTVLGFGSGIFSLARCHHHAHARRAAFERHVAAVCVEAAQNARADDRAYDRPPPDDRYYRPHRHHHGH